MADVAAQTPADWASVAIKWSQENLEPRCEQLYSEVFVATNFRTGEVFLDPEVVDRQYPEMPGFLPGTADLVAVLSDGRLLVADWKTGGGVGVREQLLTLAYGLHLSPALRTVAGDVRPVVCAALYVGFSDDGKTMVFPHEWEVSEQELVAHAKAMEFQLADVGVRTEHVQGSHCTQLYCPHLAYCDAVFADVVQAYTEDEVGKKLPVASPGQAPLHDRFSTDDEAGLVMARVAAARRQLKYYEAAVREHVDNGGRAVEGDWEYKKTATGYRWVKRAG